MCAYSSNLQDAIIQSLTGLVRILCCVCRYRTVACKTIISWVVFFRCTHLLDGVLSNVLTQLLLILMRYDKVDYFLSQTDLMHQVTGVSRGGRTHTNNFFTLPWTQAEECTAPGPVFYHKWPGSEAMHLNSVGIPNH